MMRNKTSIQLGLSLTLALLVAVPITAHGQPNEWRDRAEEGRPGIEEFQQRRLERATVFLDLNDQQVEQWQTALEARGETRQGSRADVHALHEQIRDLASASQPDATAIGELVIQAHQLKAEGEAEREAFHAELMSILTPDQQARFEAMQELRPERGSRGRHGRHGRRGRHGLGHWGGDGGGR